MKEIRLLPTLFLTLALAACSNDEGIPGPQGPQGPQGPEGVPGEIGFVFEYDLVSFTAPDYRVVLEYPQDFDGLDSDVALVYMWWENVWRPLPGTVILDQGILLYNFDFTKNDVSLFLDANFPLENLSAIDTDDWLIRVVVVPGEFWNTGARMDVSDYDQMRDILGLPDLKNPAKVVERR